MEGLESARPFSVIASEREATQLIMQNGAQRNRATLEKSVSWVASLIARNDGILTRRGVLR